MKPAGGSLKVLYVMGSGRSGSTLLDIVLGNHPDVRGVGELTQLTDQGWLKGRERCSCGKSADECPFWSEVRRVWIGPGPDGVERYVALQSSFERYRHLPGLLLENRRPSGRFREYAEATRALFAAIQKVGGEPFIVDSSKSPARAFALSMVPGIDLYLVHLTRDGRGVAASLKRNPLLKVEETGYPVWRTAVFWIAENLMSGWMRQQIEPEKSVRVRYESLLSDPEKTLREIGDLLGVDMTPVAKKVSGGGPVEVDHLIGGNRLRMSDSVRLKPGAGRWRNLLSAKEQRLSWLLIGWLMRRYGYEK